MNKALNRKTVRRWMALAIALLLVFAQAALALAAENPEGEGASASEPTPVTLNLDEFDGIILPELYNDPAALSFLQTVSIGGGGGTQSGTVHLGAQEQQISFHYAIALIGEKTAVPQGALYSIALPAGVTCTGLGTPITQGNLTLSYDGVNTVTITKNTAAEEPEGATYAFAFTADVAPGTLASLDMGGSAVTVSRNAYIEIGMGWGAGDGTETKGSSTFTLYDDVTPLDSVTLQDTESTGLIALNPNIVTAGTYTLRQTLEAGSSYIAAEDETVTVTKDATGLHFTGETSAGLLELAYTNTLSYGGEITVQAVNALDNTLPVPGASFLLELDSGGYAPYPIGNNGVVTAGGDGVVTFRGLEEGQYRVSQQTHTEYDIVVPAATVRILSTVANADVTGNVTESTSITTKKKATLTWPSDQKQDGYTFHVVDDDAIAPNALPGFGFKLHLPNAEGTSYGAVYGTGTPVMSADGTGEVAFSSLPYGKYFIVLASVPAPYNLDHIPNIAREIMISSESDPAGGDWVVTTATGGILFSFLDGKGKGINGGAFELTVHDAGAANRQSVPLTLSGTKSVTIGSNTVAVPRYRYDETNTTANASTFTTEGGYVYIDELPLSLTKADISYDRYKITLEASPVGYTSQGSTAPATAYLSFDRTNLTQEASLTNYAYALEVSAAYKNKSNVTRALSGASFKLKDASSQYVTASLADGVYTYTGLTAVAASATVFDVDSAGKFLLTGMPKGAYTIEIEAAPAGFQVAQGFGEGVSIGAGTLDTALGYMLHEKSVAFDKAAAALAVTALDDAEPPVPVPGSKFKLFLWNGTAEVPIYLGAADANGVYTATGTGAAGGTDATEFTAGGVNATALITGLADGEYRLYQTDAPAGYDAPEDYMTLLVVGALAPDFVAESALDVSAGARIRFVLDQGGTVTGLPGSKLTLSKVNSDSTRVLLKLAGSGSAYTVSDGGVTEIDVPAEGVVISGLGEGTYEVHQTTVPTGYVNPEEGDVHTFLIERSHHGTVRSIDIANVEDTDVSSLSIQKVDKDVQTTLLSGAEFEVQRLVSGTTYELVQKLTTGGTGTVLFTGLIPGTYRLEETAAPANYTKAASALPFTVEQDGRIRFGTSYLPASGNVYSMKLTNTKALTRTFAVKSVSSSGTALSGAKFTLTDVNGTSQTLTTGSTGYTEYVALAYGAYTLKQTAAATGYQVSSTEYKVAVDENGVSVNGTAVSPTDSNYVFQLSNAPGARTAMIYVRDGSSQKPLSGAVFTVALRSGSDSKTLTTNTSGYTGTFSIAPGSIYDITQTTAPSGYSIPSSGWTLTVSSTGGVSATGSGISAYEEDGNLIVRIDNTASSGSGTGVSDSDSGSGGSGGSGSTPGLPRTGQEINTGLLLLGAVIMLVSCVALMLFVVKSKKKADQE